MKSLSLASLVPYAAQLGSLGLLKATRMACIHPSYLSLGLDLKAMQHLLTSVKVVFI